MSKKRVHEIAKELKGHGIELDNKEVVNELAALGYDVKSHSSSLDDDQATAAVQKILDKRKPKQATPPVTAKGFVVRRKVGAPAGGASADQGAEAQQGDYAQAAHEHAAEASASAAQAYEEPPSAPAVEASQAPVEAPRA
ncbi:translation initiation factor IF-2 N-terminal domain-containing protein, partial [Pyxidicoccus sp. 3LG]